MKNNALIEEFKKRNISNNISNVDKFNNLDKNVKVYTGFDPSAISLHLGNYVQIVSLLRFKKFGISPLAVIGGITGMIGDPSFRVSERKYLDLKVVEQNKNHIRMQLEKYGIKVVDNLDFYKNWTIIDFLRNVGTIINVNYLLSKESIATRLEQGLSFTEFSYSLLQGWDFKTLYEKENVKIQMGGSDQWGNITTGLEMIRKTHGEDHDAIAFVTNLLLDEKTGAKFGKSTGGGSLWLDPEMTSPYSIYQFLLNQSDTKVEELLNWLTFLDVNKIQDVMKKHCENMSKRLAQRTLAYEVTKDIHSEKIATQCLKISDILFSKDSDILSLTNDDIKLLLGFLPSYVVKKDQTFIDFIKENKILNSNREIREFLSNGSFLLNNKIVNDENQVIEFQNFNKQYAILRKGKKEFIILKSKW